MRTPTSDGVPELEWLFDRREVRAEAPRRKFVPDWNGQTRAQQEEARRAARLARAVLADPFAPRDFGRRVAMQLAGRRVREAIEWRAIPVHPVGLTRVVPNARIRQPFMSEIAAVSWYQSLLPGGWTAEREPHRNAYRVGPWWWMALRRAWYYRWWALEPLLRWGLLELEDADYWRNARPRGWARLQRWLAWARADFRARMPR